MLNDVLPVTADTLVGHAAGMKAAGYRLVTLTCTNADHGQVDILYHFGLEYALKHLRLTIPEKTVVPSISPVYAAAFLVENEIQDLFGIRFEGLAIDYRGTLFLEKPPGKSPFPRRNIGSEVNGPAMPGPGAGEPGIREKT